METRKVVIQKISRKDKGYLLATDCRDFFVSNDELNGNKLKVGDTITLYMPFNSFEIIGMDLNDERLFLNKEKDVL